MSEVRCSFCGGERHETRRTEYLYSHEGRYLLVPDRPVDVCLDCGMVYYEATVLKEIERRFFAIESKTEEPDCYTEVPTKAYGWPQQAPEWRSARGRPLSPEAPVP